MNQNQRSFRNQNQGVQKSQKKGVPKPQGQGTSRTARKRRNQRAQAIAGWVNAYPSIPGQKALQTVPVQTRDFYTPSARATNHQHFVVPQNTSADYAAHVAAVLDPASAPEGVRAVDGAFAQPTSATRMVFETDLVCNKDGAAQICFDPRQAYSDGTLFVFNADTFSYATGENGANGTVVGKKSNWIPADNIGSWRCVAACMQLTSIGAADVKSGYVDVAFMPRGVKSVAAGYTRADIIEEPFFAKQYPTTTAEGIWIPRSDVDNDFIDVGNAVTSHSAVVMTCVGFAAAAKVNIRCIIHYEYLKSATNNISSVATVKADASAQPLIQNIINSNPKYFTSTANDEYSVFKKVFETVKANAATAAPQLVAGVLSQYLGMGAKGGSLMSGILSQGARMMF